MADAEEDIRRSDGRGEGDGNGVLGEDVVVWESVGVGTGPKREGRGGSKAIPTGSAIGAVVYGNNNCVYLLVIHPAHNKINPCVRNTLVCCLNNYFKMEESK